jgi:hypothetical protein
MITGSKEVGLMARAFDAGATDFITKPLNNLELTARVRSAGLLNQSLAKAHHSMSELTQLTKIRFEEPLALKVDGMSEVLALENELLRNTAGCFAMTMFTLKIDSMRGIYRSVSAQAYRRCLESIGVAAIESMKGHNAKLTYIGSGCFVVAVLERARLNRDAMTEKFNEDLIQGWDAKNTGLAVPPAVSITALSTQRIWSGMSAGDALRGYRTGSERTNDLSANEENDLFARLEPKLAELK